MYIERKNLREGKTDLPIVSFLKFLKLYSHVEKAVSPLAVNYIGNLCDKSLTYFTSVKEHSNVNQFCDIVNIDDNTIASHSTPKSRGHGFQLLKSLAFSTAGIINSEYIPEKKKKHNFNMLSICDLLQLVIKPLPYNLCNSVQNRKDSDCSFFKEMILSERESKFPCVATPFSIKPVMHIGIKSEITMNLIPKMNGEEVQNSTKLEPEISIRLDSRPIMSSKANSANMCVNARVVITSVCHNDTMEVMNQELISRKNQKMSKLSKKRRRRQKKRDTKNADMSRNSRNHHTNREKPLTETMFKIGDQIDIEKPKVQKSSQVKSNSKNTNDVIISIECAQSPVEQDSPCSNSSVAFIFEQILDSESDDDWDCDDSSEPTTNFDFEFPSLMTSIAAFHIGGSDSGTASCHISVIEISEISPELREVNAKWRKMVSDVDCTEKQSSKVSFVEDENLVIVFPVEIYDRKGEWEIYARERFRFRRRIDEAEKILSPCLTPSHREKILRMRNAVSEL